MNNEERNGLMLTHMGMLIEAINRYAGNDQDFKQDTLLYVAKRLQEHDSSMASEKTFMWSLCKRSLDSRKKLYRRNAIEVLMPADDMPEHVTHENPLTILMHKDQLNRLGEALAMLPLEDMLLIDMLYKDRLTLKRVAEIANYNSAQLVAHHRDRVLRTLRSML